MGIWNVPKKLWSRGWNHMVGTCWDHRLVVFDINGGWVYQSLTQQDAESREEWLSHWPFQDIPDPNRTKLVIAVAASLVHHLLKSPTSSVTWLKLHSNAGQASGISWWLHGYILCKMAPTVLRNWRASTFEEAPTVPCIYVYNCIYLYKYVINWGC